MWVKLPKVGRLAWNFCLWRTVVAKPGPERPVAKAGRPPEVAGAQSPPAALSVLTTGSQESDALGGRVAVDKRVGRGS